MHSIHCMVPSPCQLAQCSLIFVYVTHKLLAALYLYLSFYMSSHSSHLIGQISWPFQALPILLQPGLRHVIENIIVIAGRCMINANCDISYADFCSWITFWYDILGMKNSSSLRWWVWAFDTAFDMLLHNSIDATVSNEARKSVQVAGWVLISSWLLHLYG